MPKIVDPEQRRGEVVDAVFAVVAEHGVAGVSLRRVAEAAGLAIGSVRHYFTSAEEVLEVAAEEVIARISARVAAHRDDLERGTDRAVVAERMLTELLPLDERSRRETAVWLEFAMAARTTPAYRATAARLHAGTRALAGRIVARVVPPDRVAVETERLAALVDGLGWAGVLHPGSTGADLARAVLHRHLTALLHEGPAVG